MLVSADMAHAIHPAFSDKSESEHAPRMNGGPAIKLNVNQRYSSEGSTSARFVLLCERAEVPYQWYVHRSDMACGSTVGPMVAARLGVPSVDVGNPMLSMHSAREQCGAHDHERMAKVMTLFLEGA
jgi:aspartyl aminopeptidase